LLYILSFFLFHFHELDLKMKRACRKAIEGDERTCAVSLKHGNICMPWHKCLIVSMHYVSLICDNCPVVRDKQSQQTAYAFSHSELWHITASSVTLKNDLIKLHFMNIFFILFCFILVPIFFFLLCGVSCLRLPLHTSLLLTCLCISCHLYHLSFSYTFLFTFLPESLN
jgi:hypothetical protein